MDRPSVTMRADPRDTWAAARSAARAPFVTGAWVSLALAAAYCGVVLVGGRFTPWVAGLIGLLAVATPTLMCWSVVRGSHRGRTAPRLATAAVMAFAVGTVWNLAAVALTGDLPVPSFGDLGFVVFYPLLLGALAVALRDQLPHLRATALIDTVNTFLAVLAVLSVPLGPVVARAAESHVSLGLALALLYPTCDLMLATTLIGVVIARGVRAVSGWGWLAAGLLVFVATDAAFAMGQMDLTSVADSPMQLGWLLGLTLVARWVVSLATDPVGRRARQVVHATDQQSGTVASATAAAATIAGLAVLVMGTRVRLSTVSLVLVGLTIVMFGVRAQLAFRQLRRSAVLRMLANTDDLTGLPNRRALYAQAESRLGGADARGHALLLMDLDRFKEVNDSLGHHIGDRLLVEVGVRLSSQLAGGALLARLGGDEFAILLPVAGMRDALDLAAAVHRVLAVPFDLDGMAIEVTMSVGISLFPDHGADLPSLLRRADIAMYRAKGTEALVHVYAPEADDAGIDRLGRIVEVREALSDGEFVVHYQPKLDLRTLTVTGVEALVRWQHPVDGLQSPEVFLGLVEDAGLMHRMTRSVLSQALDQVARWREDDLDLTVAVNVSASSLMDAHLPDHVLSLLEGRGLAPDRLQLEITEDVLMADRDRARAILVVLRDKGVRIAIDDFGSGYSSLAYLRDLPIDELKIDRSFVEPMTGDRRAAALVASTIALGHSLELVVVAEGVEDEANLAQLTDLGCDQAQGFHIARPMPGDEVASWIAARDLVAASTRPG
ncbi:MAG: EAL domain-containing protein [Cellulomonadaceae bacterium]|nr:EAL domain-containing protein [Cellulomonadaceae bacterium]